MAIVCRDCPDSAHQDAPSQSSIHPFHRSIMPRPRRRRSHEKESKAEQSRDGQHNMTTPPR